MATLERGIDAAPFFCLKEAAESLEHNALILNVAHEARGPESVSKRFEKEGVLAVFVWGLPQTREQACDVPRGEGKGFEREAFAHERHG